MEIPCLNKVILSYLILSYCNQRRSTMFVRSKSYLLLNLLLLCGDINTNPGPNWKYPCGSYKKPVKSNQHGIQCDSCDSWIHTCCLGMNNDEYQLLANSHARGFVLIVTFQVFSHLRFWTCLQTLWTYQILLIFCLVLWLTMEIIFQDLIQRRVHRSATRKQN